MSRYVAGGWSHRALDRMHAGPATLPELRACATTTRPDAQRFWHCLEAMKRDGLIVRERALYTITEAGEDVLAVLRMGVDFEVSRVAPKVRVFERRAA